MSCGDPVHENCADGVDDDCDGFIDCADLDCADPWFAPGPALPNGQAVRLGDHFGVVGSPANGPDVGDVVFLDLDPVRRSVSTRVVVRGDSGTDIASSIRPRVFVQDGRLHVLSLTLSGPSSFVLSLSRLDDDGSFGVPATLEAPPLRYFLIYAAAGSAQGLVVLVGGSADGVRDQYLLARFDWQGRVQSTWRDTGFAGDVDSFQLLSSADSTLLLFTRQVPGEDQSELYVASVSGSTLGPETALGERVPRSGAGEVRAAGRERDVLVLSQDFDPVSGSSPPTLIALDWAGSVLNRGAPFDHTTTPELLDVVESGTWLVTNPGNGVLEGARLASGMELLDSAFSSPPRTNSGSVLRLADTDHGSIRVLYLDGTVLGVTDSLCLD